jgi:hypothetical protein
MAPQPNVTCSSTFFFLLLLRPKQKAVSPSIAVNACRTFSQHEVHKQDTVFSESQYSVQAYTRAPSTTSMAKDWQTQRTDPSGE